VHPGQSVRLQLDQIPSHIVAGRVLEVSRRPAEKSPSPSDAPLARLFDNLVSPGRADLHYPVRVRMTDPPHGLVTGTRGNVKIAVEELSTARRLLRALTNAFRSPI
jgi:hypothetical protein